MPTTAHSDNERQRARRRRIAANGRFQIIADLPRETVAYLDKSSSARACAIAARC